MAKYKSAVYDVTIYGETDPNLVPYDSAISSVQPYYGIAQISWRTVTPNTGEDTPTYFKLVRSTGGAPDDPSLGEVLLEGVLPASSFNYTDSNTSKFPSGTQITYSYWVLGESDMWKFCGSTEITATADDSDTTYKLMSLLPQTWVNSIGGVGDATGTPDIPLNNQRPYDTGGTPDHRYDLWALLHSFSFYYDKLRNEISSFRDASDYLSYPRKLLSVAVDELQLNVEPSLGDNYHRSLYLKGNLINSLRGTKLGIQVFGSALTHSKVTATMGENLLLDYNDSSFEESTGAWQAKSTIAISTRAYSEGLATIVTAVDHKLAVGDSVTIAMGSDIYVALEEPTTTTSGITLGWQTYTSLGVPANCTAVTLAITKPDGTVVSPAPTVTPAPVKSVTNIVIAAGTATVVATAHGFTTGNYVTIAGASVSGLNALWQITVTGANGFTFATVLTGTVTGTITATKTGSYTAAYTITSPGVYKYTWTGTGTNAQTMSDQFTSQNLYNGTYVVTAVNSTTSFSYTRDIGTIQQSETSSGVGTASFYPSVLSSIKYENSITALSLSQLLLPPSPTFAYEVRTDGFGLITALGSGTITLNSWGNGLIPNSDFLITRGIPVVAGEYYHFCGYVRGPSATGAIRTRVVWFDRFGTRLTDVSWGTSVSASTAWQYFDASEAEADCLAPATAAFAGVEIEMTGLSNSNQLYLDMFNFSRFPGKVGDTTYGIGETVFEDARAVHVEMAGARTNYIHNPLFEYGTVGWTTKDATLAKSSDYAFNTYGTKAVTSIVISGGTATVVCPEHGLATGDYVTIAGSAGVSGLNAVWQVTVTGVDGFTFATVLTGTVTGTITAVKVSNSGKFTLSAGTGYLVSEWMKSEDEHYYTGSIYVRGTGTAKLAIEFTSPLSSEDQATLLKEGTTAGSNLKRYYTGAYHKVTSTAVTLSNSSWTRISVTAKAPEMYDETPEALMKLSVEVTGTSGNVYYVDCAMLEDSAEVQPFFSGSGIYSSEVNRVISLPDCRWETRTGINFIENPSLESATTGWSVANASAINAITPTPGTDPSASYGTKIGKVSSTTADSSLSYTFKFPKRTTAVFPQGGELVTASMEVAGPAGTYTMRLTDSAGTYTENAFVIPASLTWTKIFVTGVALRNAESMTIRVTYSGAADWYFDGAQAEFGKLATPFIGQHNDTAITMRTIGTKSVTSITLSGTVATVVATAHGLTTGDYVTIAGATGVTGVNGLRQVTVTGVNGFTFAYVGSGSVTGTITLTGTATMYALNRDLINAGRSYYWPNFDSKSSRLKAEVPNVLVNGSSYVIDLGEPELALPEIPMSILKSTSFENSVYGWTAGANTTLTRVLGRGSVFNEYAAIGSSWIKLTNTAAQTMTLSQGPVLIDEGRYYDVSAAFKITDVAFAGSADITVTWYNSSDASVGTPASFSLNISSADKWYYIGNLNLSGPNKSVSPPANTASATLTLSFNPTASSGVQSVLVDRVLFRPALY